MVTRIENKACIWTVCQAGVGCKQAVMIFRVVDVWSALSAFSLQLVPLVHLLWSSLPWSQYRTPRLLTVSRVDVWSAPSAFSYPASAR